MADCNVRINQVRVKYIRTNQNEKDMEPCEQPPHSAADTLELPYRDLTVLELGHSVAAPFAGQILADLGARVVKVEKPGGDDARGWGPPFIDETSAVFQGSN